MDVNEYERLSSLSTHSNSKHVKLKGRVKVGGFLLLLWFSSTNKTECHDIAEILLKVA